MNEKKYHKKRRMFFLINNELVLPESGSDKSHMEWLLSQGKTISEAKNIIDNNLRGAVNPDGNIRFYIGENWEINEEIEKKFFEILPKIVETLKINPEAIIGGGTIKGRIGDFWQARKEYGKVKDFIKF